MLNLVVPQPYLGVIGEVFVDRAVAAGRGQTVVNAQVLEDERYPTFGRHGQRMKKRKAVRAAEDERAVAQTA